MCVCVRARAKQIKTTHTTTTELIAHETENITVSAQILNNRILEYVTADTGSAVNINSSSILQHIALPASHVFSSSSCISITDALARASVCVRACVRACVCVCVCACVRACVCVCVTGESAGVL